MKIPNELLYTRSHEWIQKLDETSARVGVTDYAQNQLGDLVFVNLPEVGDPVTPGESFADVESVKAVSDLYSPVGARFPPSTRSFSTPRSASTRLPMTPGSSRWGKSRSTAT